MAIRAFTVVLLSLFALHRVVNGQTADSTDCDGANVLRCGAAADVAGTSGTCYWAIDDHNDEFVGCCPSGSNCAPRTTCIAYDDPKTCPDYVSGGCLGCNDPNTPECVTIVNYGNDSPQTAMYCDVTSALVSTSYAAYNADLFSTMNTMTPSPAYGPMTQPTASATSSTSAASATSTATPTQAAQSQGSSGGLSTGIIVGIVLGSLVLLALIAIAALLFIRHRSSRRNRAPSPDPGPWTGVYVDSPPSNSPAEKRQISSHLEPASNQPVEADSNGIKEYAGLGILEVEGSTPESQQSYWARSDHKHAKSGNDSSMGSPSFPSGPPTPTPLLQPGANDTGNTRSQRNSEISAQSPQYNQQHQGYPKPLYQPYNGQYQSLEASQHGPKILNPDPASPIQPSVSGFENPLRNANALHLRGTSHDDTQAADVAHGPVSGSHSRSESQDNARNQDSGLPLVTTASGFTVPGTAWLSAEDAMSGGYRESTDSRDRNPYAESISEDGEPGPAVPLRGSAGEGREAIWMRSDGQ